MKIAKKKKSVKSLDDAYLDAILPQSEPMEELPSLPSLPEDVAAVAAAPKAPPAASAGLDKADPTWQDKELLVAPDAMSVTMKLRGGPAISTYQINHALTKLGVKHGIDWQKLAEAEQISQYGGTAEIVVAIGTAPERKRKVKFIAVKKVQAGDEITWLVDETPIDFADLAAFYKRQDLTYFEQEAPRVRAVLPGEILVRLEENAAAKGGVDIFGAELEPGEVHLPEIGDRKSTRLNSSHTDIARMPSSA